MDHDHDHDHTHAPVLNVARLLSVREIEHRFSTRLHLLREGCHRYGNSTPSLWHFHGFHPVLAYPPVQNVSVGFCGIEKTASSTWKGVFYAMRMRMEKLGVKGQERGDEMSKDVPFFFVREPYSRLLSAYVDKFLTPNTYFFRYGRHIVQSFRRNPSERSLRCGHDTTFLEFVKHFIQSQRTGKWKEGHIYPSHEHCAVCRIPYKYVGHLDTISEDMPYILNRIQYPLNITKRLENETLADNIRLVWNAMESLFAGCLTKEEAFRRLWKKWQIRGVLSKLRAFPLTEEEAANMSRTDWLRVAASAYALSGGKRERAFQKTEALREAYASVPLEDRLRVRDLLFLDFQLFGFPSSPDEVFPEQPYRPDPTFSYFALWD